MVNQEILVVFLGNATKWVDIGRNLPTSKHVCRCNSKLHPAIKMKLWETLFQPILKRIEQKRFFLLSYITSVHLCLLYNLAAIFMFLYDNLSTLKNTKCLGRESPFYESISEFLSLLSFSHTTCKMAHWTFFSGTLDVFCCGTMFLVLDYFQPLLNVNKNVALWTFL